MELKFGYENARTCGLIELVLESRSARRKALNEIFFILNDRRFPSGIDPEYLAREGIVRFVLNTYRLVDGPNRFGVIRDDERSDLTLQINNNTPAGEFTAPFFKKISTTLPYPISADIWASHESKEFPINPDPDILKNGVFTQYAEEGFLLLDLFVDDPLIEDARIQLAAECASGYGGYAEGSSERIQHLHKKPGPIRDLYTSQRLRSVVSKLYGTPMSPCQTLCYRFGSQQSFHSDYVHLTPFPENLMCGVWVALEDVDVEAGPLGFVPRSHKSRRLRMSDFGLTPVRNGDYSRFETTFVQEWADIASRGIEQLALLRKGQVLVWDGNLIHRGKDRIDLTKTRHSVVMHFFADGAVCLYDALGIVGDPG